MSRSTIDVAECARTLVARTAARQKAARERAAVLRAEAREAARLLTRELGARRVWLFGSLAWGEPHDETDVDLLVEGLDERRGGEAEDRCADLVSAPVDLVRVESAPPGLVERVVAEGRRLDDAE